MVNRRIQPHNNDDHYDNDHIHYYDDDYNDDYDYYLNNDDDDSGNYNQRGTAIYHYDPTINDYSGAPNNDDDNYFVHFAAHHDHYIAADDLAADDDTAAPYLNINIYYYEYDNNADSPPYDHNDPATYYDDNFNYRGPDHDPPNNNTPTLF